MNKPGEYCKSGCGCDPIDTGNINNGNHPGAACVLGIDDSPSPPSTGDWEKEFDRRVQAGEFWTEDTIYAYEMKSFIRSIESQALERGRREGIEEALAAVPAIVRPIPPEDEFPFSHTQGRSYGYNEVRDILQNLLSPKESNPPSSPGADKIK